MPTKIHLVKATVFPVVMYGCESWTIKKAEHQRIDAFEPQCWRRLLRVPWTARRSNKDDPERWYGKGGGRRGSGLTTRVHPWRIHVDV